MEKPMNQNSEHDPLTPIAVSALAVLDAAAFVVLQDGVTIAVVPARSFEELSNALFEWQRRRAPVLKQDRLPRCPGSTTGLHCRQCSRNGECCCLCAVEPSGHADSIGRADPRRFEERVQIELRCFETPRCGGMPMKLMGNWSLKEAGADATRLGYECRSCFRQVTVTDGQEPTTPEVNAAHDEEP